MTRLYLKVGDIFKVRLDSGDSKYFQFIGSDHTQLDSDVIRCFKTKYSSSVMLEEIVTDEIETYIHCMIKQGIKMNLWEKIGNSKNIGETGDAKFKESLDYGVPYGQPHIKISSNWRVWKMNEAFLHVSKPPNDYLDAEIGLVFNSMAVVSKIKDGSFGLENYPSF